MSSAALTSLDAYLARILTRIDRAPVEMLAPRQAAGCIAADNVIAPASLPTAHTALRSGIALSARQTVGAAPQSPLMIQPPQAVMIGEELPPGCDAVADPAVLIRKGAMTEIAEQFYSGQNVRLAGHDLRAGEAIVRRFESITNTQAMVCELAGLDAIPVVRPHIFIADHATPMRAWLAAMLTQQGAVIAPRVESAALAIHWNDQQSPVLALAPGAGIQLADDGAQIRLTCPTRFDCVCAFYAAILLPCLAAMTGRRMQTKNVVAERKISSAIGVSEIVLLVRGNDGMHPCAAGDITLDALLMAEAFTIVPPHSEGMSAGASLPAVFFNAPFEPGRQE